MKLQHINPQRPIFTFACIRCGKPTRSDEEGACADLHGIPFRSYYCSPCASVRRAERMRAGYSDTPVTEIKA